MKRLFAISFIVVLFISLVACSGGTTSKEDPLDDSVAVGTYHLVGLRTYPADGDPIDMALEDDTAECRFIEGEITLNKDYSGHAYFKFEDGDTIDSDITWETGKKYSDYNYMELNIIATEEIPCMYLKGYTNPVDQHVVPDSLEYYLVTYEDGSSDYCVFEKEE